VSLQQIEFGFQGDGMDDKPREIEQKLIEFATKTADTIQTQAGQNQALSHVMLIAIVSMNEQHPGFKRDFIDRIVQVKDQLSERPIDQFTKDYFTELVRFLDNPYQYSADDGNGDRPRWFKGIIAGGKAPENKDQEPPSEK
jgi:hypothetical protein